MLKKNLLRALLAACCCVASAQAAVVPDAAAPDSGMPAFADGSGVVFSGVSDAELLGAEDYADAPEESTPLAHPYSMLLIGLVMLGFTSARRHTEAFSPDP